MLTSQVCELGLFCKCLLWLQQLVLKTEKVLEGE